VASSTVSAASVAKILSEIKFPKNKNELIEYAEQNKDKVEDPDLVIEALKELHDTHFYNLADVEEALGDIR
jgi:ubiquinone biosynthesis protein COQ9